MLKGSEKQVSWAKRIKAERLTSWIQSDPVLFREIETTLKNELSASWWITYREKSLRDVLPYIVEGGSPAVKAPAKPNVVMASPAAAPVYSSLADVRRFVGELRSVATGEVVIDAGCPF